MLIDITLPLDESTPPFPGDPPLQRKRLLDFARGDEMQLSAISLSAHLGTHVDAPLHFFAHGKSVAQLALKTLCGPVVIVEIFTTSGISADMIRQQTDFSRIERMFFKTRARGALYPRPSAWLEPDAAALLVKHHVRLVGIDSPSIDNPDNPNLSAHRLLLQNEVIIVENLVLHEVASGPAELFCLPLKLVGGDGAPARVILRRK
ncbi:cyclase family protein [candidate division KSB1 bacterium]|nr:cyclase family protein [candidate division KSB1 bacterium]